MNELYVRALVAVVLASIFFGAGWKVATWRSDAATAAAARQYATDLAAAEDKRHNQEQAAISRQASIEASYLTKLEGVKHEKDAAVAAANKLGLWVTTSETCNSSLSGAAPAPGVSHGGTKVRLAEDDAGFILTLASTADQYATQLIACQQVILNDRKVLP